MGESSEQDWLNEIKARMNTATESPEARRRYLEVSAPMDLGWLVREIEQLQAAIRQELVYLWSDLEIAKGSALNGQWSIECEWLVERIKQLTLTPLVGPAPWQQVQISLLEDGTYQRIHRELGITVEVDMQRVAQVRAVIQRSV